MSYTYKLLSQEDAEGVTDLLLAISDELLLPDRAAAQKVTNLLFEKGGVAGGFHEGQLCGILGYFWGDPNEDFADKQVLFLYVGAILEPYRLSRMFLQGLSYTLQKMQARGAREIRLQAEAANSYTNKLYGRFARPVAEGHSLRGVPVITYGASIQSTLDYLEHGRRRPDYAMSNPVQYSMTHQ